MLVCMYGCLSLLCGFSGFDIVRLRAWHRIACPNVRTARVSRRVRVQAGIAVRSRSLLLGEHLNNVCTRGPTPRASPIHGCLISVPREHPDARE